MEAVFSQVDKIALIHQYPYKVGEQTMEAPSLLSICLNVLCIKNVFFGVLNAVRYQRAYIPLDFALVTFQLFTLSPCSEDSEEKDVKTKKDDSHSAGNKQV